jgi:hypothetical protein
MMKSKQTLPLAFILCTVFIISCTQPAKDVNEEKKATAASASLYPSMTNEEITNLYSITDKVDMIFYNLPMSINQDDARSAKNTALYISPAPALMNNPCKALGRLSWISKGAIVKEADIFCDTGCQYFIFMTDNKPVAANAMSESGVVFFNQILSQAAQQRPK